MRQSRDSRTAEDIARERAEMAAVDAEIIPIGRQRTVKDLAPMRVPDFLSEAARLKAKQPPNEASQDDIERQRIQNRRGRLTGAGVFDKDAIGIIAVAKKPPVVPKHEGSRAAFVAAFRFLEAPRPCECEKRTLLLMGPPGTGKTYGLYWIIAGMDRAYFMQAEDYLCDPREWAPKRERALKSSVFCVNDLANEAFVDYRIPQFTSLISRLHDEGKRCVMSANVLAVRVEQLPAGMRDSHKLETIEGRYGVKVASRLSDTRYADVVSCPGGDIRGMMR